MDRCRVTPPQTFLISHGSPDPLLSLPLCIRLFLTSSAPCLSLILPMFPSQPSLGKPLSCANYSVPFPLLLLPATQYYPLTLSLIHSFSEHLLNAWCASNT